MPFVRRVPLGTALQVAAAVLLGIIALALHPHLSGHPGRQAALRQMVTLSVRDRLVHGTLLLLLGALLAGLTDYALRRGLTRRPIVAGLVGFATGIGGLFAAGLIDGFMLPEIVARSVTALPAAQDAAIATLTVLSVAVNTCTAFGLIAMAIGIAAWSADLVSSSGESRIAGIAGFVAAAVTVTVLVTGGASITSHGLIVIFAAQGAWYVWVALVLAKSTSAIERITS